MGENVEHGDTDTGEHAGDGTLLVHGFTEDSHHQGREDGAGRQTEGDSHGTGREARRIQTQITCNDDRAGHGDFTGHQLAFFTQVGHELLFEQVMGNR